MPQLELWQAARFSWSCCPRRLLGRFWRGRGAARALGLRDGRAAGQLQADALLGLPRPPPRWQGAAVLLRGLADDKLFGALQGSFRVLQAGLLYEHGAVCARQPGAPQGRRAPSSPCWDHCRPCGMTGTCGTMGGMLYGCLQLLASTRRREGAQSH